MIRRLLNGLVAVDTWHRVMLHNSAGYRRFCQALAVYLTTGYWDLRPQQDEHPY